MGFVENEAAFRGILLGTVADHEPPLLRDNRSFLDPLPSVSALGLGSVVGDLVKKQRESVHFQHNYDAALIEAARNGHADVVVALLKAGTPSPASLQDAILNAAYGDHDTTLQHLVPLPKGLQMKYWDPEILCRAAWLGLTTTVTSVLETGVEVDGWIGGKMTPLQFAARNNHEDVVNALLKHGAEIESPTDHNDTPLAGACSRGCAGAAKALLDKQANVNAFDDLYHTPLVEASHRGFHKVVLLLLDSKAKVAPMEGAQFSALAVAACCGSEECVPQLLEAGADPDSKGPQGTALLYAIADGDAAHLSPVAG